jgi:outer membrane protein assembly factor BamB
VLYAAGDQTVRAYRAKDGTTLWTQALGDRAGRRPLLAGEFLVVPVSDSLLFLDPASGRVRAEWDPGEGVTATPLWTGTHLVVLSNDGFVYAMYLPARRG